MTDLSGLLADLLVAIGTAFPLMSVATGRVETAAVQGILMAAAVCVAGYRVLHSARWRAVALAASTFGLIVYWLLTLRIGATIGGIIGWAWFVVRLASDIRGRPDLDTHLKRMLFDLVPMLLATLFGWEFLGLNRGPVLDASTMMFAAAAVLRLVALRQGHVHYARQQGIPYIPSIAKPFIPYALLAAGAVLYLWYVPASRSWAISFVILAAFGIWVWKVRRLSDLGPLVFIVFVVFAWALRSRFRTQSQQLQRLGQAQKQQIQKIPHSNPHPPLHIGAWIGYGLLVLGVVLLLTWLWYQLRRRKHDEEAKAKPVITRTKLPSEETQATVPRTPMRKLMAAWLRSEQDRGLPIQPGETVVQFVQRSIGLRRMAGVTVDVEPLQGLVQTYERERYGQRMTREEDVRALEQRLKDSGLIDPKAGRGKRGRREDGHSG